MADPTPGRHTDYNYDLGQIGTPDFFPPLKPKIEKTTRQMFNARVGAIRHKMAQRSQGSPPQKKGPIAGNAINIEDMIQGYYAGIGFQPDGVPTAETLQSLGLDAIIPDLAISTGASVVLINKHLANEGNRYASQDE